MIEQFVKATLQSNNPNKTRAVRLRADITSTNIGDIAPTTIVEAGKKFVAERDGEFGLGSLAGDIWWHVPAAKVKQDNTPRNGHIAQRHKGEELLIVTLLEPEVPEEPEEPTTPEGKYDVSVFTSSKKIVVTSDQDLSQYVVIVNDKMFGDVAEG